MATVGQSVLVKAELDVKPAGQTASSGSCDYGNTARLALSLPPGYTFTSQSGAFLTNPGGPGLGIDGGNYPSLDGGSSVADAGVAGGDMSATSGGSDGGSGGSQGKSHGCSAAADGATLRTAAPLAVLLGAALLWLGLRRARRRAHAAPPR
jgi:hypothetical protein